MPKIRQYIAQQSPQGRLNVGPGIQALDFSGIAQGAQALVQAQERVRTQLDLDEARVKVENATSEAQMTWTERIAQAKTKAPADAAGFTEGTLKEFDAWAKPQIEGMQHPEGKKLLEDRFRRLRLGLHAEAFNFETGQRTKALAENYYTGLDDDRSAVLVDPSRWASAVSRRVALAESMNVTPDVRAKMVADARERLSHDAATGIINQPGGPEAFLALAGVRSAKGAKGKEGAAQSDAAERVASNPILSAMSPESLRSHIDRASMIVAQQEAAAAAEQQRRQHEAEMAAARRERAASQGFSILSATVQNGYKVDESLPSMQAAMKAIEGTPYAQAYRDMLKQAPQNQAAAVLPIERQQAELDAWTLRRNTQGSGPEVEKEIARREKVLAATKAGVNADPLEHAASVGKFPQVSPLDVSSIDAMAQGLPMRSQQAAIAAEISGKHESPLRPAEAAKLRTMLSSLAPDQFGAQVAKLSAVVPGQQLVALARQIDPQDKSLALALAAGASMTTEGRTVSELIRRGAQVSKDRGVKEDTSAEFGVKASLAKEVGDAVPPAARADVLEAARLIYLAKQGEGSSISVSGAVRLAIGGDIIEHNGRRLPVPAGVADLPARLQAYPRAAIDAQAPDGFVYLPGGRPMGVPEFLAALPSAQLEPDGLGRYLVRSGGSLVMNQKRRPIVVEAR